MKRKSLYFTGRNSVELHTENIKMPERNQVLIQSIYSAISPGTEMLVYQNKIPKKMEIDDSINGLKKTLQYPLKYGYAIVGKIMETGKSVKNFQKNDPVFTFHPHESHFIESEDKLLPIPEDISLEDAVFIPNMETAVNFIMDGRPLIGEKVAVFGQGIVGLLTTAILSKFPINRITTFDLYKQRRDFSLKLGATTSVHPLENHNQQQKFDLLFEISGNPEVLNLVLRNCGYQSRIVVGSWYGSKESPIQLGDIFHRNRLQIISSQVSTIHPEFSGRWNKQRRFSVVFEMIRNILPSSLITDTIPIENAPEAYEKHMNRPGECIQTLFTYD